VEGTGRHRSVTDSTGLAVQDLAVAVAVAVYERWRAERDAVPDIAEVEI
jgi:ornithine cyclodeaminase/alanine dehydrogenase-like protein (mu-crystallin family)